ncbi:MAG TPA: inositol phosphorylceramide synthase [Pyrodictium sp.]|nr:inositol phosphorylceramide synthase [Pyrodictium sp.]
MGRDVAGATCAYRQRSSEALRLLLDMMPFLAAYAGYELARGVALALRGVIVYEPLLRLETTLFGKPLALLLSMHRSILLDVITGIIYALHPLYFLAFAAYTAVKDRHLFRRLTTSFVIASIAAIPVYALWPTAPPWIAIPGVSRPPNLLVELAELILGSHIDPNPFAAMPSMHVCIAVIFAYYYWRLRGKKLIGILWVGLMAFSTLYTANHYLADVLAGALLGLVASIAGWRLAGSGLGRSCYGKYEPERRAIKQAKV